MSLKGQASMVDILLLGLFISVVLVMSNYIGDEQLRAQVTREESQYAESMLLASMQYRNDTYGSYKNVNNFTVAQAIDLLYCRGQLTEEDLGGTLQYFFNKTIRPGYNYIFFSQADSKVLQVWNRQSDVCAKYMPLVTHELGLSCSKSTYYPPMMGIWPEWKKIPTKAECD